MIRGPDLELAALDPGSNLRYGRERGLLDDLDSNGFIKL
jgi:hypothetical protein